MVLHSKFQVEREVILFKIIIHYTLANTSVCPIFVCGMYIGLPYLARVSSERSKNSRIEYIKILNFETNIFILILVCKQIHLVDFLSIGMLCIIFSVEKMKRLTGNCRLIAVMPCVRGLRY